jgi:hypothetical protein
MIRMPIIRKQLKDEPDVNTQGNSIPVIDARVLVFTRPDPFIRSEFPDVSDSLVRSDSRLRFGGIV